ncbi:MAG: LysR family transcriptional regulator [Lachnospiraceae bacterium]|nr:LysR family transcriptional regulator [Lachnospiraceae bacterium]MBR5993383.1 LysR family transcriptional regulator [Lachnospiraceae bacterium]
MELRHIRYFMAVAEEMNFTKAAEKLNIAQPPLSRQIKDLENELGTELFERTSHALHLTEAGILFKQYAAQMLEIEGRSKADISKMGSSLKGLVYIATVEGYGPHMLAEWIAGFRKLHPDVSFDIWSGTTDEIVHRTHNGLCDIAIVMEPFSDPDIISKHIHSEPWAAIIPKSDPLASQKGKSIKPEDFAGKPLIMPSRASRNEEFRKWMPDPQKPLNVVCKAAHMINVRELAKTGMGIAIFPRATGIMGDDEYVTVKNIDHPKAIASYLLIKSRKRRISPACEAFWDYALSTKKK